MRQLSLVVILLAAAIAPARPCTTFVVDGAEGPLFSRNYDWVTGTGMLTVNARDLRKTALVKEGRVPARWTAQFGSVTFNQYGREFPTGGMNEAGLVVELMWLDETRYAAPDSRPELSELQWIQHQLDTAASVADVISSDARVRISADSTPLHFLIADRKGGVAAIEFLEGRLVAHTGEALQVKALTNSRYGESVAFFRDRGDGSGEGAGPALPRDSLGRFATAARRIKSRSLASNEEPAAAFRLLEDVSQPGSTRWSIVYDLARGRIHFKTTQAPGIRRVDLARLNVECGAPPLALDLGGRGEGDVSARLAPCDGACQKVFLAGAFSATGWSITPESLDRRASHPGTFSCEAPRAIGP